MEWLLENCLVGHLKLGIKGLELGFWGVRNRLQFFLVKAALSLGFYFLLLWSNLRCLSQQSI